MQRIVIVGVVALVGVIGAVGAAVSAQVRSERQVSTPDDALLAEIKGLRQDIRQLLAVNLRAQVLVTRVQLQEQRIQFLMADLARVATAVAGKDAEIASLQEHQAQLQAAASSPRVPEEVRQQAQEEVRGAARRMDNLQQEARALRSQHLDLTNQVGSEQQVWGAINSELEEITSQAQRQFQLVR